MPALLLATNNAGKVRELQELLAGCGWDIVTPAALDLALEVEETGTTYAANAELKARAFAAASGLTALADDSGLEVDALDGAPGVYSARYAGHSTTHGDKMMILLNALEAVPSAQRGARFRAVIAIARPDGWCTTVEGVCEGRIAPAPRGAGGFGYDPIFLVAETVSPAVPPLSRTMAELSDIEKNLISHRARAARHAREILRTLHHDDTSVATPAGPG